MFALNLPSFEANIVHADNQNQIFDILRRRYVALTPEEWVRQHFIHYLIEQKHYPASLLSNEVTICLNGMTRRCDSILYNNAGKPQMIIEYKSPSVRITQKVFSQILAYNNVLKVGYIIVSNGMQHYCCHIDYSTLKATYLQDIPDYNAL